MGGHRNSGARALGEPQSSRTERLLQARPFAWRTGWRVRPVIPVLSSRSSRHCLEVGREALRIWGPWPPWALVPHDPSYPAGEVLELVFAVSQSRVTKSFSHTHMHAHPWVSVWETDSQCHPKNSLSDTPFPSGSQLGDQSCPVKFLGDRAKNYTEEAAQLLQLLRKIFPQEKS